MVSVNWTSYSNSYDMIRRYNPAYVDLINQFKQEIQTWDLPKNAVVADIGAGTGSCTMILAEAFPHATILHIEPNQEMLDIAVAKQKEHGFNNIEFMQAKAEELNFEDSSLSAIICVNSIYTFPQPKETLKSLYRYLKPNGYSFLCDAGRSLGAYGWFKVIAKHLIKTEGPIKAAKLIWKGRFLAKPNKSIKKKRNQGAFWSHTHEEFCQAVSDAQFHIINSRTCFEDCSDLVIATKKSA